MDGFLVRALELGLVSRTFPMAFEGGSLVIERDHVFIESGCMAIAPDGVVIDRSHEVIELVYVAIERWHVVIDWRRMDTERHRMEFEGHCMELERHRMELEWPRVELARHRMGMERPRRAMERSWVGIEGHRVAIERHCMATERDRAVVARRPRSDQRRRNRPHLGDVVHRRRGRRGGPQCIRKDAPATCFVFAVLGCARAAAATPALPKPLGGKRNLARRPRLPDRLTFCERVHRGDTETPPCLHGFRRHRPPIRNGSPGTARGAAPEQGA